MDSLGFGAVIYGLTGLAVTMFYQFPNDSVGAVRTLFLRILRYILGTSDSS